MKIVQGGPVAKTKNLRIPRAPPPPPIALDHDEVFVFGSNLGGHHGAGSAHAAYMECGALWGVGAGPSGRAYAIPTKDEQIQSMPLERVTPYVHQFIQYAEAHPHLRFRVVKIGCGLAGFREEEMAPLFEHAPANCLLPAGWRKP
jgi:hypothetical protein